MDAFWLAIQCSPQDGVPTAILADWLEENGEPGWAGELREALRRGAGFHGPVPPID